MSKPVLPQGTRDFPPEVMYKRKFILQTIEKTYSLFGFMPLETPAMENLSTLTGKYGSEGDQLLYKLVNSGDYLKDINLVDQSSKTLTPLIADKGLRYDLTVPLARFVATQRHTLSFPFKRFQVQPVWRADRPQKGRYREFWQFDADVLGSDSMLCEADFIRIYHRVFKGIGLENYEIRINHRKILEAVTEKANAQEHFKSIATCIDKADKIGLEGVKKELLDLGLQEDQCATIALLLNKQTFNKAALQKLSNELKSTPSFAKAEQDLLMLLDLLGDDNHQVVLDGSLARGLDYYTGCIFEVVPLEVNIGSISGGGRYDDLTSVFGLKEKVSGIGISFGIDRIYDVMEALQLFNQKKPCFTNTLFCPMEESAILYCNAMAEMLRSFGIKTEIYPNPAKMKKQLDYANSKGVHWAIIVGENEMEKQEVTVKNLESGWQETIEKNRLLDFIIAAESKPD